MSGCFYFETLLNVKESAAALPNEVAIHGEVVESVVID